MHHKKPLYREFDFSESKDGRIRDCYEVLYIKDRTLRQLLAPFILTKIPVYQNVY